MYARIPPTALQVASAADLQTEVVDLLVRRHRGDRGHRFVVRLQVDIDLTREIQVRLDVEQRLGGFEGREAAAARVGLNTAAW